jgi:hypothetical protein
VVEAPYDVSELILPVRAVRASGWKSFSKGGGPRAAGVWRGPIRLRSRDGSRQGGVLRGRSCGTEGVEHALMPMANAGARGWDQRGILHPRLRPETQSPVL